MANSISGISLENALANRIQANAGASSASSTAATSGATSGATSNIDSLQQQIAQSQQTIDNASQLQATNNTKIEELEKEVEELKKQIVEEMQNAINEGQAFTEEQQGHINDAVTVTVAKYLNGEISKDQLMSTLSSTLATTEGDMATKLNSLIEGKSEVVDKIEAKIGQICDLAKQNDELGQKIKDAAAKIASAQSQIAAEQAASSSGCCDPIGFETDDAQYDFVIDRDNDGEFDNEQEFLGAKNGFDEMKALDTDGNGVVEGDELKTVKLIKTDKNSGTQSFVTAAEAGVSKIDLSTYEKTGYTQANGNEHVGKFNVEAQGKTIEGYQTLDKTDYLKANYGNTYGKSMNSNEQIAKTPSVEDCPKTAEVSKEAQALKVSAKKAEAKAISYNDVKGLNADKERKLVDNGVKDLEKWTENSVIANNDAFSAGTTNLKDEAERDKELGKNQDSDKTTAEKSQKRPSTTQFMSMAYAFQAQEANKKKEEMAA